MGLDMYLEADKHISGYSFYKTEEQKIYSDVISSMEIQDFVDPDTPSGSITVTVGYWRKANQIHAWFVDNVQDGEDNCARYPVDREELIELRDLCQKVIDSTELIDSEVVTGTIWNEEYPKGAVQFAPGKILKDPSVAHELLPSQEGFFFGGTDYDEFYYSDLVETIEIIDRVLKMPDDWYFYYQSSW